MPTEYTLADLSRLTGVSPRTVRYYIASGLLPAPLGQGLAARYSEDHLDRLRLIRKLQSAHLPLAEIRRRLEALPEGQVTAVADAAPAAEVSESALEYVSALLRPAAPPDPLAQAALPVPAAAMPTPAPPPPHATASASREPDRAQWERISLDQDIELHVRRPLTRHQNKRVERLISIARQLLQEE